jgi:hypothetical protein
MSLPGGDRPFPRLQAKLPVSAGFAGARLNESLTARAENNILKYRNLFLLAAMTSENKSAEDGRGSARRKYLRMGTIVYNHGTTAMSCAVFELSATGARVRPDDLSRVPDTFELQVADGPVFQCEVIHRQDDQLGVRFV